MTRRLLSFCTTFLGLFGIYILWIVGHYAASHLYVYLCTPGTIIGFILSPFIAPAPHCVGLRWLINTGGSSINAMWILFGLWLTKYFIPIYA